MPGTQPVKDYFCIESIGSGNISMAGTSQTMTTYEYSYDGRNWTSLNPRSSGTRQIAMQPGRKAYIRGTGTSTAGLYFGSLPVCDLSGNIMSLLYGDDFEDKFTVGKNAFAGLFNISSSGAVYIRDASELKLPATTLGQYCYYRMFVGTGMQKAPKLPAMVMEEGCYEQMFMINNLEEMPELPATTLAKRCYSYMFSQSKNQNMQLKALPASVMAEECYNRMFRSSNITHIPYNILPATTLAKSCYGGMFEECKNIKTIPADLLPASAMEESCYSGMFSGCTGLTYIPARLLANATTMAYNCFGGSTGTTESMPDGMFSRCKGLTQLPHRLLPSTSLENNCYYGMFAGCTNLTSVPSDLLPATTLAQTCYGRMFQNTGIDNVPDTLLPATVLAPHCYTFMFSGCTNITYLRKELLEHVVETKLNSMESMFASCINLTAVPDGLLQATTLGNNCYRTMFEGCRGLTSLPSELVPRNATMGTNVCESMFNGCTGLVEIPEDLLPNENLNLNCYLMMFEGCTSLTNTCDLNATTLAGGCYRRMFNGCTSLVDVTDIPATDIVFMACEQMFNGCTSLVVAPAITILDTTGGSSCIGMFHGCTSLTDISGVDLSSVSAINSNAFDHMFKGCENLEHLPTGYTIGTQNTTVYSAGCRSMFRSCTKLVDMPYLPMTTVLANGYNSMFAYCSSLEDITGRVLPARIVNENAYEYMFQACEKLSIVPAGLIQATIFYNNACSEMFSGCKSLTVAPYIRPSENTNMYATSSFYRMFKDCYDEVEVNGEITYTGLERMAIMPGETRAKLVFTQTRGIDGKMFCEMFMNCKAMTEIPIIVTTVFNYVEGCKSMFEGCSSLTNIPQDLITIDTTVQIPTPYSRFYRNDLQAMFKDCTSLVSVPQNLLSGSELLKINQGCYKQMFMGCVKLTGAPALPATIAETECYMQMFDGCEMLTSAPALPATTTIGAACYNMMFNGCIRLTQAPDLPMTTHINPSTGGMYPGCYNYMFAGCEALENAPQISISSDGCATAQYMFQNCTSLNSSMTLNGAWYARGIFENCESLENVTLNASGDFRNAFKGCINLLHATGTLNTTTSPNMFDGCEKLIDGPTLTSTSLGKTYDNVPGYHSMFKGCKSLTIAPNLIATSTAMPNCYEYMFQGCESLINPPSITHIDGLSINYMFDGCKKLKSTPVLNGTFSSMKYAFNGCIEIESAPITVTFTSSMDYTFNGCVKLETVTSITRISENPTMDHTFTGCKELTSVGGSVYCGYAPYAFSGCESLVNLPQFVAPATAWAAAVSCYAHMFEGCKSLVNFPSGLFKNLKVCNTHLNRSEQFSNMFDGCTELQSPENRDWFEVEECLGVYAFDYMFKNCKNFTQSPIIRYLPRNGYYSVFEGCERLDDIVCLVDRYSDSLFVDWVKGVSPTGTFTKKRGVNWNSGNSGIPNGWTINEEN